MNEQRPFYDRPLIHPAGEGRDIVVRRDISYLDEDDPRALMDIYLPAGEKPAGGFPTLLFLHGGPLADRTILAIYRELMSGSLTLERAPRIAYLGPPGSYSHLAAKRKFGSSVDYEPVRQIAAVFDEIERGHVDLGLSLIHI